MTSQTIAPHETFELHELLTFKNVCATKASTMVGLVKDQELKSLMQQDFSMAQGNIKELQSLLQQSTFISQNIPSANATVGTTIGNMQSVQ